MYRVRGLILSDGSIQLDRFARHLLRAMLRGAEVIVTVKRKTRKATRRQFGWYRGLIWPAVYTRMRELGWSKTVGAYEMPITPEDTHEFLKHVCARDGGDGRLYTIWERPDSPIIHERHMTTQQHTDFIRNVLHFANAEPLECGLPLAPTEEMEHAFA